jgi:hypothetical protein
MLFGFGPTVVHTVSVIVLNNPNTLMYFCYNSLGEEPWSLPLSSSSLFRRRSAP